MDSLAQLEIIAQRFITSRVCLSLEEQLHNFHRAGSRRVSLTSAL